MAALGRVRTTDLYYGWQEIWFSLYEFKVSPTLSLCVCVGEAHMYLYAFVCVGQMSTSSVISEEPSTLFLGTSSLSRIQGLSIRPGWWASKSQGSYSLHCPPHLPVLTGITCTQLHAWLFKWCWEWNSGAHTCVVCTFLTELSSLPKVFTFMLCIFVEICLDTDFFFCIIIFKSRICGAFFQFHRTHSHFHA